MCPWYYAITKNLKRFKFSNLRFLNHKSPTEYNDNYREKLMRKKKIPHKKMSQETLQQN